MKRKRRSAILSPSFASTLILLQEKSDASDAGSQAAEEDYDVDEEYDNDYADNYFDNGEGDDLDDLGGGGGDATGGGT
jgi:DNA-directed RNA polymerase III subunit RPC7